MMIKAAPAVVTTMVVFMAIFGCGASDPEPSGSPGPQRVSELENALRSKPPFEAAKAEYNTAMIAMATQIAALLPGTAWVMKENSWGPCGGQYVWTRAVRVYQYIVFDHAIPDEVWPTSVRIVIDGAARFGATNLSVLVDQPGSKSLAISNSDGVTFEFGTGVQTIFSATSDCRMHATDTPVPTPIHHP